MKSSKINIIIVNITWNSNDWRVPSEDSTNHRWAKEEGNIPHESWNFDFDNKRNSNSKIFGYAQFTNPPKNAGENFLIIFSSKNKIVGFYGKGEVFRTPVDINKIESYNLVGDKQYSLSLDNKIVLRPEYLEGKKRIGQIGFNNLNKADTAITILKDALEANPHQKEKLQLLLKWVTNSSELKNSVIKDDLIMEIPLNQILYGPPGTGKTYTTIDKSVQIAAPEDYIKGDHSANKSVFDRLVKDGRIVFTTFHQSLGYEDFIEGIKPVTDNGTITYETQEGIFKQICEKAKPLKSQTKNFDWSNRRFLKMSLGGKQEPEIHNYCLKEDRISLGWGGLNDLSKMENIESWTKYKDEFKSKYPTLVEDSPFHIQASWKFLNMKKGDIVVATMGNHIVDAIGVVEGDYEFIDDNQIGYPHERKVNWLVKNLNTNPDRFFKKKISQQTIYEFYSDDIKVEAFEELTNTKDSLPKNYVIIIDEINRGNVSQIFGELITLIEEDKRAGNTESIEVILPYSKKQFSVPPNLYIIGTMNTADRSVEALDVALRRRFKFEYLGPNYNLEELQHPIEGIDYTLADLLRKINERITFLKDGDHQIGHSYLLNKKSLSDLTDSFYKHIIPLLKEYFFNDYGKIRMILGDSFVEKEEAYRPNFAADDGEVLDHTTYRIRAEHTIEIQSAIQGIFR